MPPEEEWKVVRRKGGMQGSFTSGNDDNLTSFYVSNLHGGTAWSELWDPCAKLGDIKDVYIAGRKDKAGSFFAFVKFSKVNEQEKIEAILKGLQEVEIRGEKLMANCAKHPRTMVKKAAQRTKVPTERIFRPANRGPRSFAEVTKGCEKPAQKPQVNLECVPEIKNWAGNSILIGEVRSFDVLCNFPSLLAMEGYDVVDIKYLGGMQVSVKFRSIRATEVFKANKGIWLKWFVWVDVFGKVRSGLGRIAWVKIVGVPVLAWDESNFAAIAGIFGRVLVDTGDFLELCGHFWGEDLYSHRLHEKN